MHETWSFVAEASSSKSRPSSFAVSENRWSSVPRWKKPSPLVFCAWQARGRTYVGKPWAWAWAWACWHLSRRLRRLANSTWSSSTLLLPLSLLFNEYALSIFVLLLQHFWRIGPVHRPRMHSVTLIVTGSNHTSCHLHAKSYWAFSVADFPQTMDTRFQQFRIIHPFISLLPYLFLSTMPTCLST